jgi:predicted nucleic acid-binding protein
MYLAGREGGWAWQAVLWRWVRAASLVLLEPTPAMLARIPALMEQYQDLPMDLADASLVAVAEERRLQRIFTLDSDFRVYRLPDGGAFDVVP